MHERSCGRRYRFTDAGTPAAGLTCLIHAPAPWSPARTVSSVKTPRRNMSTPSDRNFVLCNGCITVPGSSGRTADPGSCLEHLIRRNGHIVQDRPSPVVGWADIPGLLTYV